MRKTWEEIKAERRKARTTTFLVDEDKSVLVKGNAVSTTRDWYDIKRERQEKPGSVEAYRELKNDMKTPGLDVYENSKLRSMVSEASKRAEVKKQTVPASVENFLLKNPKYYISSRMPGVETKDGSYRSFEEIEKESKHVQVKKPFIKPSENPKEAVIVNKMSQLPRDPVKDARELNPYDKGLLGTGLFSDRTKLKSTLGSLMDQEGIAWAEASNTGDFTKAKEITMKIEKILTEYPEMTKDLDYNKRSVTQRIGNFFRTAVEGTAEMLPTMINAQVEGFKMGAPTALGFMGGAVIGGQMGPQALAPEEILTVPGAGIIGYKIGSTTGVANHMYSVEKGQAYKAMIEEGVPADIANRYATIVGAANAGLELLQLDELMKSVKLIGNLGEDMMSETVSKYLKKNGVAQIQKYIGSVGKETTQEVAQEMVTMTGEYLGKKQAGQDVELFTNENAKRLLDTAIQSGKSFMILQGAGQVTGSAYRAFQSQNKKDVMAAVNSIRSNTEVLSETETQQEVAELAVQIDTLYSQTKDSFYAEAKQKLVQIQVDYANKAQISPTLNATTSKDKQVVSDREIGKGKEQTAKSIEEQKDGESEFLTNSRTGQSIKEANKKLVTGSKVNTKNGELEIIDNDGTMATVKNNKGNEYKIGVVALDKMVKEASEVANVAKPQVKQEELPKKQTLSESYDERFKVNEGNTIVHNELIRMLDEDIKKFKEKNPKATQQIESLEKVRSKYNVIEDAESETKAEKKIYRATGKTVGKEYTTFAYPILGEADYYATTPDNALQYGDKLEEKTADLKNPLVIQDDDAWREITEAAGWEVPSFDPYDTKVNGKKLVEQLKEAILSKGYDGVVIDYENNTSKDLVNQKTGHNVFLLDRLFSHDQVVDYTKSLKTNKESKANKEAKKEVLGIVENKKIKLYHGSYSANIDKLKPSTAQAGLGIFLTDKQELTKNYGENAYEVEITPKKIATDSDYLDAKHELESDLQKILDAIQEEMDPDVMSDNQMRTLEHEEKEIQKQLADFEDMAEGGANAKISKLLKEKGFDVLVSEMQSGDEGVEVLVLDESIISSTKSLTKEVKKEAKPVEKKKEGKAIYRATGKTEGKEYVQFKYPILGGAMYYTTSPQKAKKYGDHIEKSTLSLKNPLIINDDVAWRKMTTEAGWVYPMPSMSASTEEVKVMAEKLKAVILKKGYDGVIIEFEDFEEGDINYQTGNPIKTLRNVFGEDQVVDYTQKPQQDTKPVTEKKEKVDTAPKPQNKTTKKIQVFHGTPYGEFNEFKSSYGAWFSETREVAEMFSNKPVRGTKSKPNPFILEAEISVTNTLDLSDVFLQDDITFDDLVKLLNVTKEQYNELLKKAYATDEKSMNRIKKSGGSEIMHWSGLPQSEEVTFYPLFHMFGNPNFIKVLKELGYDSVTTFEDEKKKHRTWLVFDNKQIKTKSTPKKVTPKTDSTKTQDFGEKIGGARKDQWRVVGLDFNDLENMNDREIEQHLKKDSVWGKLDYTAMVEEGIPREVVYAIKKIKDAIPVKPYYAKKNPEQTKAIQKQFIDTIKEIKQVLSTVKTRADAKKVVENYLLKEGYLTVSQGAYGGYVATEKTTGNLVMRSVVNELVITDRKLDQYVRDAEKKQFAVKTDSKLPKGYEVRFNDATTDGKYGDWKANTYYVVKGNYIVKTNFDTKEDAENWLKEMASKQKEGGKKRFIPPQLKNLKRDGPDYRDDLDVKGQDYLDVFGFKGGEFGNWLNENDRKQSLNYGYDALMDLANVLGIEPSDISLDKTLSVAFGARGVGGASAAVAHYEPARRVINLTKMKGAGSLAHEWFHALDDFLGTKDGTNDLVTKKGSSKLFASIEKLVKTMKFRNMTAEEAKISGEKWVAGRVKRAKYSLDSVTHGFEDKLDEKGKIKLEALKERYLKGDETAVDEISELRKEVVGRIIPKQDRDDLFSLATMIKAAIENNKKTEIRQTSSKYYDGSKLMGEHSHKDGDYWDSNIEMAARAFACYVNDKLEGKRSDYLNGHSESYVMPYIDAKGEMQFAIAVPQGEERIAINKAFDELFEEIKKKGVLTPKTSVNKKANTINEKVPMEERTFDDLGSRDIKAYQFENPQVKPYFKSIAEELLTDLNNTTKGEKLFTQTENELVITGTPRITSPMLADIKDSTGASYDQIKEALQRLIKDEGQENIALAKRIEVIIDEALVEGYKDYNGQKIPPNKGYIQVRNKIEETKIKIPEYEPKNMESQLNEQLVLGPQNDGDNFSMFDAQSSQDFDEMLEFMQGSTPKSQRPLGFLPESVRPVSMTEKFKFDDDIEVEHEKNRIKPMSFRLKIIKMATDFKHISTRTFREIDENNSFLAEARKELINYKKLKEQSGFYAGKILETITSKEYHKLSREEFNRFERFVLLRDLMEDLESGRELPYPYTAEKLPLLYETLRASLNENIEDAIARRDAALEKIKNDYIKAMRSIGFNKEDSFTKKNYFRHQVLEYYNAEQELRGSGSRVRGNTNRGFTKHRDGTAKSINEDYLQAEFETLWTMIYDTKVAQMLDRIKKGYDITAKLKAQAKNSNQKAFDSLVDAEVSAQIKGLDMIPGTDNFKVDRKNYFKLKKLYGIYSPLMEMETKFRQLIAMNFSELSNLADNGLLPNPNDRYTKAIDALMSGGMKEEDSRVMEYLSFLADQEDGSDGKINALGIFSAIDKKEKLYKESLKGQYYEWRHKVDARLIPPEYDTFQPIEGKRMMFVNTVTEEMAEALLAAATDDFSLIHDLRKSKMKVNQMLAMGGDKMTYILPAEVSYTLQNVYENLSSDAGWKKLISKSQGLWKRWILQINPFKVIKYNLRNVTGDLDGLLPTAGAGTLKFTTRASKEAWEAIRYGRFTKEMLEFYDRGGLQSNFYVQEIADVNKHKIFDRFRQKSILDKVADVPKSYVEFVSNLGQARETVLRYAAYLYYKETIKKNGGKVNYYGASKKAIIDGLKSVEDKAFQLSNDALGAYDQISELGQALRKYVIPFWSWTEINFKRYKRIAVNAHEYAKINEILGKKMAASLRIELAGKAVLKLGSIYLRVMLLTAALYAWNRLVKKDDDDKLPESVQNVPHLTLYTDEETGNVVYYSRLGALTDLLEWFGLDTLPQDIQELGLERKTWKEQISDNATAPLNKIINSLSPFIKSPIELLSNQTYFPDFREPRHIRDGMYYIAQSLGLEQAYTKVMDLPLNPIKANMLMDVFVYVADPEQIAYYRIIDLKRKFEKNVLNKAQTTVFSDDPKSEKLYYMKLAMKYGDLEKTERYLFEYFELGGTERGFERSITSMNPLYGLDEVEAEQFMNWLTTRERADLDTAVKFYIDALSFGEEKTE